MAACPPPFKPISSTSTGLYASLLREVLFEERSPLLELFENHYLVRFNRR